MEKFKFYDGQDVVVSRLGEKSRGHFHAKIRGISAELGPYGYIWIVEWIDKKPPGLAWTCSTMPESCIDTLKDYIDGVKK